MNKYMKWYNRIIESAVNRQTINGYCEVHHIIPKALGGSNDQNNLVKLTAREHYVCHLLLMKAYTEPKARQKMASAFLYMSKVRNDYTEERYNSRLYEYHKKIRAQILSEQMAGSGNAMFGRTHSEETRKKISDARKGINTNTEAAKEAKRKKWLTNNPNSDPVARKKITEKRSGKYIIIHPNGVTENIQNLSEFCRKHKVSAGNLVYYGHSKGYHCSKDV